jgi:hypothetical protein
MRCFKAFKSINLMNINSMSLSHCQIPHCGAPCLITDKMCSVCVSEHQKLPEMKQRTPLLKIVRMSRESSKIGTTEKTTS